MGIKGKQGVEYILQLSEKGSSNTIEEQTIEILSERLKEYGYADKQFSFNVLPDNQLKVSLEAIDDIERVKKLLTERGYFSMQECFNKDEIFADEPAKTIDLLLQADFERKINRLQKTGDTQAASDVEENGQNLFSSLFEVEDRNESAELGYALAKDTSMINRYLTSETIKYLFPSEAIFLWSRSPHQNSKQENQFALYAAKIPSNDQDYLDNKDIEEVRFDRDYNDLPVVGLSFKKSSHKKWELLSAKNKNRAILIIFNDKVVSAPVVMEKITVGAAQISGGFSETETADLVNMLGQRHLPVEVELVSEEIWKPEKEK